ncbi:MAG TPA: ABC transporter substrate-binding protein [Dermatophilaceae bacterium]
MTAAAGAASLALVLSACGGSTTPSTTPTAGGGGGTVIAYGSEPQNPLLPANTNETGGGRIMKLLFEGLISYDAQGKPVNQVASSIDTTDGQNYTIKLAPGWKFTNGEAVNAKSFVDAWNFGALIDNAQLNAYFFEPIDGYKEVHPDAEGAKATAKTMKGLAVVDDSTFTVKLTSPQASFPLRLGYTAFFPMPQSAYKDMKAQGENPVGNGSYMLDGKWVHNVEIKVKKNPDYKGTLVAKNAGVDVKVYTDPGAGYIDLLANNLDVIDTIPDNALASFTSDLGSRAINQPAGVFQAFDFPLYQPEWKGDNAKKVRQAISMAIDRKTITEKIFQGTRTPANDFSSPVVSGYDPSICGEICVFDATKAKAKLAEAGGFTGKLEIAYNADGGHKSWVDAVCNSIKNTLAIDCSGKSYPDFKSLRDPITKGVMKSAFRAGWQMDYPALENFLAPLYAKGAGSNDSHYDNPAFDALLKKGDTAKTLDESIAAFQDAERLLVADMPSIPLWYSNTTGGYSEKVSNVKFDVFGVPIYTNITKK